MRSLNLLAFAAVTITAACGGGGGSGGTAPPTVASVAMSRPTANLRPSEATTITATAEDAGGTAINGKTFTWDITPSGVATIVAGATSAQVTGVAVGTATLTATADGKVGSVAVTVTNTPFASTADVTVDNNLFRPSSVDIAAGGTVTWTWAAGAVDHNVTFTSGPASIASIPTQSSGSDSRTFASAGTYAYHCTIHAGMTGTVVVH